MNRTSSLCGKCFHYYAMYMFNAYLYVLSCLLVSCKNLLNFNFKLWFESFFRPCALYLLTISWEPEFTHPLVYSGVCISQSLVFCVVFCRVLFIFLSFFALRRNALYLQTFLLIKIFRMYINTLLVYY